ncbi:FixH family protein [Paenibacillus harenae]|uniref:FixH family protein n=1 Tax=Paenibacillus harenae TaxID=306543 RepID=UPI0003F55438|nr:FixH family protein [Paenibacillus harenae]
MTGQPESTPPLLKLSVLIASVLMAVFIIVTWVRAGEEAAPPVTEHEFEIGQLVWSIDAYPAKVLHGNSFTVDVTGLYGIPLEGAKLAVKLDMLSMVCGDVDFQMTEIAPGKYTGEGIPLMAGTWKATLTLEEGGETFKVARLFQASHV